MKILSARWVRVFCVLLSFGAACRSARDEPAAQHTAAPATAQKPQAPALKPLAHASYPRHAERASGPDASGVYFAKLRVDVADGYDHNPTALARPLRQDVARLRIASDAADPRRARLTLLGRGPAIEIGEVDLSPLLPFVPKLARGDAALTRIALVQQEFNRLESRLGKRGEDYVRLANNCLRAGLWEVMLGRETPAGHQTTLLAWFDFPEALYARAFERATGLAYRDHEPQLAKYPELNGIPVPLAELRTPLAEAARLPVEVRSTVLPPRFAEQRRKHILIGNSPEPATLAGFTDPRAQPILMSKFDEPGFYNTRDPMKFDLRFLAAPRAATWRRARNPRQLASFDELEVPFADGRRLLLGHARLAALPALRVPPNVEDDSVLRLTFGIGSQDVYMDHADRLAAFARDEPAYLFLLDAKGAHVDNHFAGLDRVYVWREAGRDGAGDVLHLWLVGYERIAIVAHYTLPFSPPL